MDQAHTAQDDYPNDTVQDANSTDTFQDDNPGGTAQDLDHKLSSKKPKAKNFRDTFFAGSRVPGYPDDDLFNKLEKIFRKLALRSN